MAILLLLLLLNMRARTSTNRTKGRKVRAAAALSTNEWRLALRRDLCDSHRRRRRWYMYWCSCCCCCSRDGDDCSALVRSRLCCLVSSRSCGASPFTTSVSLSVQELVRSQQTGLGSFGSRSFRRRRCFPHCCPQHVARSYCGASAYLQVDFDSDRARVPADSTRSLAPLPLLVSETQLHVFGHFRLTDAPSFQVGHRVSRAAITQSLMSETNPMGEWVCAKMLASANHVRRPVARCLECD